MSAVRFSNTYHASPIRVPMFFEKKHKKYVKNCLNYYNNSEMYTSKNIKNIHLIEQSNDIVSIMMYIIMTQTLQL